MNRIFLLSLSLCALLTVSVFAAENEDVEDVPAPAAEDVQVYEPFHDIAGLGDTEDPVQTQLIPYILTSNAPESSDLGSDVLTTVPNGAVTHEDPAAGTMKAVVQSIFGEYKPVEQTVTVYLADGSYVDGSEVINGISGVDWVYISGVSLFALCLAALFKLLRVVINGGSC